MYEPMRLILTDGTDRQGSQSTLHADLEASGTIPLHEDCYSRGDDARESA